MGLSSKINFGLSLMLVLGLSACSDSKKSEDKEEVEEEKIITTDMQENTQEENDSAETTKKVSNVFSAEEQEYYNKYLNRMIRIENLTFDLSEQLFSMINRKGLGINTRTEEFKILKDSRDEFLNMVVTLESPEVTERFKAYHDGMSITSLTYAKGLGELVDGFQTGDTVIIKSGLETLEIAKKNLEIVKFAREEAMTGMFFFQLDEGN